MDCRDNLFCASLPEEARCQLCAHCHIIATKAGSQQLFERFVSSNTILLKGLMTYSIDADADVIDTSQEIPVFFISIPGRFVSKGHLFSMRSPDYMLASVSCVSDCLIACLDADAVAKLATQCPPLRDAIMLSYHSIIGDLCIEASIFRSRSAVVGTMRLMRFLLDAGVYANQGQLAYLLNRDRTTISRAVASIEKAHPDIYNRYCGLKGSI